MSLPWLVPNRKRVESVRLLRARNKSQTSTVYWQAANRNGDYSNKTPKGMQRGRRRDRQTGRKSTKEEGKCLSREDNFPPFSGHIADVLLV